MFEVFKKNWKWFLFPIGIILVYGLFLIFITSPISEFNIEKAGQFGDSFGIINTLFSGSAFIALVVTIYLQQQDMKDTKEEIKKQNFENTFFKMIDLYNNLVKDLYLERPTNTIGFLPDGTEQFEYLPYEILGKKFFVGLKDCQGKEVLIELVKIFDMYKKAIKTNLTNYNVIEGEYEDFYKQYEEIIGHYFRTIYQIVQFIDENKAILEGDDKKIYINLFISQFSKKELKLLYFHCKSSIDKGKIMPILDKYYPFTKLG